MHRLLLQEFLLSFTLGDLVDVFTRSGSFAFLSDLFDTERLFELPDYRVARVIPKGEDVEPFVVSMYLVLDLTDKYPHDYLTTHFVEQFLPELFTPWSRRVRVRQIVSNVKRFQSGEWKGLWETTLCFARWETVFDTNRKYNHDKRDTSLQTRVVYVEHCSRREHILSLIKL